MFLEIEELLGLDGSKRTVDIPAFEEVPESSGRSITGVVPSFESDDGARPAKVGSFEASYRVHPWKAIGHVS